MSEPKMTNNLPNSISRGQVSRLFPSLSESNKEMRATSTFLSVIRAVPELLDTLVASVGVRINDRTTLQAFTEVTPARGSDGKYRPDGLIYVKNKNTWSCFVETKVGKSELDKDQIENYLKMARKNGVDAVLTISNEFTARIEQSPIELSRKAIGKINLLHLSWREILSKADALLTSGGVLDREKRFLLEEFVRFLRDQAVGNTAFAMMPDGWNDLNERVLARTKIKVQDPILDNVAAALQQQYSEMAIILTEHLGVQCKLKLQRVEERERSKWTERIRKNRAKNGISRASFFIPGAVADLEVQIDIARSAISFSVEIDKLAPRKTPYGKAAWVLSQLPESKRGDLLVSVRWNTRAKNLDVRAPELLPKLFKELDHSSDVKSVLIKKVISDQVKFKSRKKFIVQIERELIEFYDNAVQHLKPFIARVPVPQKNKDRLYSANETAIESVIVPDFLKRI
jgi:hypothetical protein